MSNIKSFNLLKPAKPAKSAKPQLKLNNIKCMSVKNKKETGKQCPNKRRKNSDYCGVHIKTKKVTRIDMKIRHIGDITIAHHVKPFPSMVQKIKKEYFTLEEMSRIPSTRITYDKIDKSIRKLNLQSYIDLSKMKDIILTNIKELHTLYTMATNNLDKIIKLQAFIKMRLIHNRYKCVNHEDFLTFEDILDIKSPHFFNYYDPDTNKYYGFNVQTFHQLITKNKEPLNPYTRIKIPDVNINRINKIILFMKSRNYKDADDMLELSEQQKFNAKILDIFSKIDDLGNITDVKWFTDLNLEGLKNLYIKAEDLWSYRLQMPLTVKSRIVDEGIAFTIPVTVIKNFDNTEKRKLQHFVLNEINKLVSEGETNDDKKIGAMIVLTAFTEVVHEAAQALPHLIQSNW